MKHALHDAVGLEIARRIAAELHAHPEWITIAKANLERWSQRNRESPALLKCYREWQNLLKLPVDQIASALVAPTEDGQRLRQNSPFAGALPPQEIWEIKRRAHETTAA